MREKDQPKEGVHSSPQQPVAGSPADLDKRAQNENPRANENIRDAGEGQQDTSRDVGAEITDGEDA